MPIVTLGGGRALLNRFDPFIGGDIAADSILDFVRFMATGVAAAPTAGGTLKINGESLGSYDFCIVDGDQVVSSFSSNDWFTTTADSRSAFVIVKGNLTINAAQVFKPSARKLFTCVYATGGIAVDGELSMSARGANHSAGGGNVTAAAIRIATGAFSGVTNPQVPAAGANGAAAVQLTSNGDTVGNNGSNGSDGATGGGASGGVRRGSAGNVTSGAGANGTSFSGGPAGGGASNGTTGATATTGETGDPNGAAGGDGARTGNGGAGGGAGNPGGAFAGGNGAGTGDNGTGGVLIAIAEGAYSGTGSVTASGANGGQISAGGGVNNGPGGGASGGGSVTIMAGSDSGPTPSATGGIGGAGLGAGLAGGNGGNGTARKLTL